MNKYKFGNHICRLREDKGLTQNELAQLLGVSDKAVSKWENGQSVPRMETFEALAHTLGTTVEELIAISKDGATIVYIKNDFTPLINLEIDGKQFSLKSNEKTYVEVNPDKFTLKISGDLETDEVNNELDEIIKNENKFKNKLFSKATKKLVKHISNSFLLVDCNYICEHFEDGQTITVTDAELNLGDAVWTYEEFIMHYPVCESEDMKFTLQKADGKNKNEYIKKMKNAGIASDIGLNFFEIILNYPLRGLYFKHLCKSNVIKKNITNADKIKERRSRKKPFGCLSFLGVIFIVLCVWCVLDIILTPYTTPAVVSGDYSTVTYYGNVYKRIDTLPENAKPEKFLGADTFDEAVNEGNPRLDQWTEDSKVQSFADPDGNKYLWLIENYTDTVLAEEMTYEDFKEIYVYILAEER